MVNNKRLLIGMMLIIASFSGVSTLRAQDPTCPYTLASLQGSYTVVGTYGPNLAYAHGKEFLDGKGNMTRASIINQPKTGSTTGERTVSTTSQVGTYTVNCNGTGTFIRTVTQADGSITHGVDDFIITQGIPAPGWSAIAITIIDAQRNPSNAVPGGVFLTRIHTRLPETNPFGIPTP